MLRTRGRVHATFSSMNAISRRWVVSKNVDGTFTVSILDYSHGPRGSQVRRLLRTSHVDALDVAWVVSEAVREYQEELAEDQG